MWNYRFMKNEVAQVPATFQQLWVQKAILVHFLKHLILDVRLICQKEKERLKFLELIFLLREDLV